jgi:hypothetical protein
VANCTVNGLDVVAARVERPRVGNWTAELAVDVETAQQLAVGGAATIVIGDLQLQGTVLRGGPYAKAVSVRVVGGKNGLSKLVKPRFYRGTPLSQPLNDVLKDAGEALSADAKAAVLQAHLDVWTQLQRSCSAELASLCSAAGVDVVWRVQPDGTVYVGADGFSPTLLQDFELVDSKPLEDHQVLAAENPDVHPGESFDGRKVSDVAHLVDATGSRVQLWFEP